MNNVPRIQQVSRKLRYLLTVLLVLLPILSFFYWFFYNELPTGVYKVLPGEHSPLAFSTRMIAYGISLLPIALMMLAIYSLVSLFKLYESAILFSLENVRYFRILGYSCCLWTVASIISTVFISALAAASNEQQNGLIITRFEFIDLFALLIGLVSLLVSWVMYEGHKLNNEQAYTV